MIIRKSSFVSLCMFIAAIIVCNIVVFSLPWTGKELTSLSIVCYASLLEVILFSYCNSKIIGRTLSFSFVFMIVLYIFHFGQIVIFTFFRSIYSHVRILLLLGENDILFGYKYINLAFSCMCLGMLSAEVNSKKRGISSIDQERNQLYSFEGVAKDIILITFPIKVIIDVICMFVSLRYGGPAARAWINAVPNILVYFGKVSLVGFALLMLVNWDNPKKERQVFLFIEAYILIMMISGIRSENVGYLLVFTFLHLVIVKKAIHIPSILIYSLGGLLVLSFVVATGSFRSVSDKSIVSFWNLFLEALTKKNVVLNLLDTCGDTGYTAQCVINKWLPIYGPSYGDAYTWGWFAVIPNIPGVLTAPGQITASSCFALKLQAAGTLSSSYLNIGGSALGELFFNFGLLGGSFASLIAGWIIGGFSKHCSNYIGEHNYSGMIRVIPFMFAAVYWVRDYFGGGIREVIWSPVICFALMSLFKRYKNERALAKQVEK